MAYSNTTNETKITVRQLIEYAFRASGKTAEEQTPEYIEAAKQALYYILMNLSNRGVNLWMLENKLIGLIEDQKIVTLPESTIDIREANWSYNIYPDISDALPLDNPDSAVLFNQSLSQYATSTIGENWFGALYQDPQRIVNVGFNAYAPDQGFATYNFVLEATNDSINWFTVETFPETTLQDGTWAYYPINTTPQHIGYRLRETVAETFSLRQITFSYVQQVIPLARLNRDDYWNLPNKDFPSQRSLQYWYDRKIEPQMYLWPIPSNDFQMLQLIIEKQIEDVGNLSNELYVPNRWIAAVQAWLSHELSMQIPGVDQNRIAYLEARYKEWLHQAEEEERDKSPIYYQPNYSYYTR